ncbi:MULTISPECIES: SapC family protein [unclassified Pseudoalteromonas]|uniref:SapC family protein n=1 Tax=unclassified Pseudoalteromonas TaxID=194690 RepID=UPI0030144FAE
MSESYEIINPEQHQSCFVQIDNNHGHAEHMHVVKLLPQEVAKAAAEFPICFMRSADTEPLQMVAIMGLEKGHNAYFSGGRLNTIYVPLNIVRAPFSLAKTSPESPVYLAVKNTALNSEGLGEKLFDENGKPSNFLTAKKSLLQSIASQEELAEQLVATLTDLGLLVEFDFKYDLGNGQKKRIPGLYSVDKALLKSLDDETKLSLVNNGLLEVIYSHLLSLGQFQRVVSLAANQQA